MTTQTPAPGTSRLTREEQRTFATLTDAAAQGWALSPAEGRALVAIITRLIAEPDPRAEDAEAKLAAVQRVIDDFLRRYGASTLPVFRGAVNHVADPVRSVLKGSGVAAREQVAAAERERLLGELAGRKVTLSRPGFGLGLSEEFDVVLWPALADLLTGLPTTGCEEVRH